MSEAHDILFDVVLDRASFTTDPVKNLRTGLVFTAEIEPVDPLLAQTELGEDAREVVILHVTDDVEAGYIRSQDLVQFQLFGSMVKYKIVKRRNNAANVQTDFWAMQVVDGKDT
jgi:hypothetical protein